MSLEKYISDLLYRYDLVIVPGFGGIIGRKKHARLDHENYIFSPPHKDLSFNIQLSQNDGLLANYIREVKQISYREALEFIESSVTDWQETLQHQKRLKLEQIGIFNLVADQKIIFLPLTTKNYLAEAYGLTSFIYKPFDQEDQAHKQPIDSRFEQPKSDEPVKTHKKRNRSVSKKRTKVQKDYKIWRYAAIFVVGLGLFTAGISLLRQQNKVPAAPHFQKATFVLKQDFPPVKIHQNSVKSIGKISKPQAPKYFVISGAFRDKANAVKKETALKRAGYPAQIIGQNKYGLWLVAYQGFSSDMEARQVLKTIKDHQIGAWIFAKE